MTEFRKWLEGSPWTAAALARKITAEGVATTRKAVSAWAAGTSRPSIERLAILHKVSGGAVNVLMFVKTLDDLADVVNEEAPSAATA